MDSYLSQMFHLVCNFMLIYIYIEEIQEYFFFLFTWLKLNFAPFSVKKASTS